MQTFALRRHTIITGILVRTGRQQGAFNRANFGRLQLVFAIEMTNQADRVCLVAGQWADPPDLPLFELPIGRAIIALVEGLRPLRSKLFVQAPTGP